MPALPRLLVFALIPMAASTQLSTQAWTLPEMGPQVTTPTGGTGGPLGNITSKCGGDATPMGVETGRLQAPVTMGAATQTAPSGLTTGIRTGQTVPTGPSP